MKNKLYFISISAVLLIPFVAPWEGACQLNGGYATRGMSFAQAALPNAASFMPVLDWNMADLDARDAQNNPIRDASVVQNLTELFTNNLFALVVVKNLHSIDQIWNELESISRLFNNLIFNVAMGISQAIPKAWIPSVKRFVHNVHNLWIALSVGLFFSSLSTIPILIKASRQRLILRC